MTASDRTDTWQPLLDGPQADDAWQAIRNLADDLRAIPPAERAAAQGLRGPAAEALFFAYLAEATEDDADVETSTTFLEAAIDAIGGQASLPMLYGGFVGVGWVTEHLQGRVIAEDDDSDSAIDEVLLAMLPRGAAPGDFDLISGLTGLGVYALEALPRASARRALELVVDRLDDIATASNTGAGAGLAWFIPPERLPDYQRRMAPAGLFNLGVAHGVPGPATLLALIGAADVAPERCRSLAEKAVRWLLAQRHDGDHWRFASWAAEGLAPRPSRLGWCYGDPGVAAALLAAARAQDRSDWRDEALEIARAAARRDPESGEVKDPALCHGTAGLGHLFHRLYQASGDRELGRAARFWFERTLALRRPGEGIGGFLSWLPDDDGSFDWRSQPGFLTGATGVGLALLSAVSTVEPQWDRLLLCS